VDEHLKMALMLLTAEIKNEISALAATAAGGFINNFEDIVHAQTSLLGKVLAIEHIIKEA